MRLIVTGVAGFLGSNLLAKLLAHGHEVTGIDNLSMGSIDNISTHLDNRAFTLLKSDVTQASTFDHLEGDCIVHLAAFKIPRYGHALETLRTNQRGCENVLELARRTGSKCVLASTSDVYGRSHALPFTEDGDCVLGPSNVARWSYAVSKLFDEHLGLAYAESAAIAVTILRFFGSYGPHHHLSWWGGPPAVFIDAVLRGQPVPIHGDGLQRRSFTYVSDTVDGIYAAITNPAADGQIINIGNTQEVTILQLAQLVQQVSGASEEVKLEFVPYESFTGKAYQDVRRRVPDVSKCERILGVKCLVPLSEGLRSTIDWQRRVTLARP